jgi:DNA polymerase-1
MKIILADIETDGLDPTKIHVMCCKNLFDGKTITMTDPASMAVYVVLAKDYKWVFHNGLNFDVPVINKLLGTGLIDPKQVVDTFVVSRLVDYKKFRTHSLEELGLYLGVPKSNFTGNWSVCAQDMVDYCEQDVRTLEKVWEYLKPYVMDPTWAKSMRVEHDMATICYDMQANGFTFDISKASDLLAEVSFEMGVLEAQFDVAFPPTLKEDRRIKLRRKKDGTLMATVLKAMATSKATEIDALTDELVIFKESRFNPGSSKDRIDVLNAAGWKPIDKTDGHKEFLNGKL